MQSVIRVSLVALIFLSDPARAVRTAVFPEEIRPRAAVWLDEARILSNETAVQSTRPVWVHAGDSLSTAWGNKHTLREKWQSAQTQEIPEAGSMEDIFSEIPSPR